MSVNGVVRLSAQNWIWLIVTIATAVGANVVFMYTTMGAHDRYWQARTDTMVSQLRAEIQRVDDTHPPRGLETRIENNEAAIRELERTVIRLKDNGSD